MSTLSEKKFKNDLRRMELKGERNEALALSEIDVITYKDQKELIDGYLGLAVFFSFISSCLLVSACLVVLFRADPILTMQTYSGNTYRLTPVSKEYAKRYAMERYEKLKENGDANEQ